MNDKTKRRTKIIHKHARAAGGKFDVALKTVLEMNSSREEDKRPSRSGTMSYRYAGI